MPFVRTCSREPLRRSPRLFDLARRLTRAVGHRSASYRLLKEYSGRLPKVAFIQIGSNDGIAADPLREFIVGSAKWHGVFVEPVPQIFAQLQRNYAYLRRNNLRFCNAAISAQPGTLPLWKIKDECLTEMPPFAKLLCSFDRRHLIRHLSAVSDLDSKMEAMPVRCMTYEQLRCEHGLSQVDVLNIDAEGHDDQILRSIDFAASKPNLILFEVVHMRSEAKAEVFARLRQHGYALEMFDMDCAASLTHPRVAPESIR